MRAAAAITAASSLGSTRSNSVCSSNAKATAAGRAGASCQEIRSKGRRGRVQEAGRGQEAKETMCAGISSGTSVPVGTGACVSAGVGTALNI